jgi:hypothetical protein
MQHKHTHTCNNKHTHTHTHKHTYTNTHTTAAEKRAKEIEEELARTKKAAAEKAAVDAQVVIL